VVPYAGFLLGGFRVPLVASAPERAERERTNDDARTSSGGLDLDRHL